MNVLLGGLGWVLALAGLSGFMIARGRMAGQAQATARACHELRGPLTAARLGLELAGRARQLSDPRRRAIELELARATQAVEDLTRVCQRHGDRGMWRSPGAEETIDVAQLLVDSVEAWRPAAAARGVELRLIESSARPLIRGRQLRLAQATGNLIANAIEHGGGVVEVGLRADQATTRIEVVDRGAGLPAPVADLIRTGDRRALGRGSGRRTRWLRLASGHHHPGGVTRRGHGLAVAGAVAAAHGGRLAAAPAERGARLVLELPNAQAEGLRRPAG